MVGLEVHTTHAAARRHCGAGSRLLRQLGDHGLGGDQQRRNRSCVLDRHAHDLGRVDDALGDQVAVFAALRVEAIAVLFLLQDLADPTTTELSSPALIAIWRAGKDSALRTISTPVFWSSFCVLMRLSASVARNSATPPPGRMPSSTAARVACVNGARNLLKSGAAKFPSLAGW